MKKKKTTAEALANRIVGGKFSEMATYSDLFEKTSDAIFFLDLDNNNVIETNPSVEKIFGAVDFQNKDFTGLVAAKSRLVLQKNLLALRDANSKEAAFDLFFTNHRNEEIILEVNAGRLRLGDYCEVIQLIGKDVTMERKVSRELLEANQQLATLSSTDEMTKLFNFRHFRASLKAEHERGVRYKKSYAIILCDIDHFKNFNDKNGHPAGDEALRRTAAILQSRSRNTDIVARYGGEEFVVLCPEVDGTQAQVLAESLRKNIEGENFVHGEKQPLGRVTISIGVASFPADGVEPDEVLRLADNALYEAKAGGRNQVRLHTKGAAKKKAA